MRKKFKQPEDKINSRIPMTKIPIKTNQNFHKKNFCWKHFTSINFSVKEENNCDRKNMRKQLKI